MMIGGEYFAQLEFTHDHKAGAVILCAGSLALISVFMTGSS
jgi:hypothetical protein